MLKLNTLMITLTLLYTRSLSAQAAGTQYDIRVDGLACPFCAYGIEKKFVKTDGVKSVDINIAKGLVIVKTGADKSFTDSQLREIINDAGFTMKSYTIPGNPE